MTSTLKHKLHFPDALEWMWSYCTYVGSFTDSRGKNYDLGFAIQNDDFGSTTNFELKQAIVYGNDAGKYMSGDLHDGNEISAELKRRLIYLKIIKE